MTEARKCEMECSFSGSSIESQWPKGRFLRWLSGKESACQCRRHRCDPWVRQIPWRRKWQSTPAFLPGKSHGQRNHGQWTYHPVQLSSVIQSCLTFCDSMDHSTPGLPVHHQLPESIQTHLHWVSDVIQPSHPLPSPSPPVFSLSQHQGLFKWVSSLHQVAKVEFQLQHQSFQWTPRTDLL